MAVTVMILGSSGDGKSNSIVVNPDGVVNYKDYAGMNAEETVIFNCDGKEPPFPAVKLGWEEGKNLFTSTFNAPLSAETIAKYLDAINSGTKIKSVIIDTINGSLNDKEMLETRKLTYDKWYDLAKDYYSLCVRANSMRKDLLLYFFGHTMINDEGEKGLVTNGKRLEKIKLESKVPVVLYTNVENGLEGENKFTFMTQRSKNSCKSPIGMFDTFLIPNSLKLVDDKVRNFYEVK